MIRRAVMTAGQPSIYANGFIAWQGIHYQAAKAAKRDAAAPERRAISEKRPAE